ncbi:unnamed protein product [Rotaria sp. Silwood2]|nr:unnamed protein product [Rotaria sp. Silwood2]CAF2918558.1 unnamed protein product [Rotaria sp. Silwood2]CAF3203201.1 unnamed protein product [Rotaria sp. Silwood2]
MVPSVLRNGHSTRTSVKRNMCLTNESGNDDTWLTVFGFRANADAQILIDDFSRFGVIEKYVIVDESNIFHIKFEAHLQAQHALKKT